jgi:hypothetical protein
MHGEKLIAAGLAALVVAGAGAGIAQSATGSGKGGSTRQARQAASSMPPGHGPMGHDDAVHSVAVVPNKAGTGFVTQTTDGGTVKSVDAAARAITITESVGTGGQTLTYGTPTLTIASDATVVLDGKSSSLASLAEGDRVTVSSSSDGTAVFAADSSFRPDGAGRGPGGPPAGGWGGY